MDAAGAGRSASWLTACAVGLHIKSNCRSPAESSCMTRGMYGAAAMGVGPRQPIHASRLEPLARDTRLRRTRHGAGPQGDLELGLRSLTPARYHPQRGGRVCYGSVLRRPSSRAPGTASTACRRMSRTRRGGRGIHTGLVPRASPSGPVVLGCAVDLPCTIYRASGRAPPPAVLGSLL